MIKHELNPINNFLDALRVRTIRNQCRIFMTNDISEISILEQLIWYFTIYRKENKNNKMICFLFKHNNTNSGFGLVRHSAQKYWITGGLKISERGKGLGKVLFSDILKNIPSKNIWLEVLDSNVVAKRIYLELGFSAVKDKKLEKKKIILMKLAR